MSRIRWGVLSTARIATVKVIPAMQRGHHGEVAAIASRNEATARAAADTLGIPTAYGSYDALLADPSIDAIYNPLPNHLHVPWSIRALEAGKHVLCEKPLGLNVADAQRLVDAARAHPHLKVMEAFMYRFHPQWQHIHRLIRKGSIGSMQTVQSHFSYFNDNPADIRNQADIGGGGLLDIGCYCISLSRWLFEAEPQRVCASIDLDPQFGTDRLASAILDFGRGTATFTCSTQATPHQHAHIFGTKGRIEIDIPFTPLPDQAPRLWHHYSNEAGEQLAEEITLPSANQYTLQGDAFARAILDDTPVPTPLDDALGNLRVIEAIGQSAEQGAWVSLAP